MKLLKVISFMGIVLSIVANLISWTSPNPLYFAIVGIPLEIASIGMMAWLYHKRVMPLQHNANLRWLHHSPSLIHALMFLAILSLAFHSVVAVAGISLFVMFLIRAMSSIWLYTFAATYGYAAWSIRYGENFWRTHRSRFQDSAQKLKADIPTYTMQTHHKPMRRRR